MAYDIEVIQNEVVEWLKIVHPNRTPSSTWIKFEEEKVEVMSDPHDIKEWGDLMILLLDLANQYGHYGDDILMAAANKMAVNKSRSWEINDMGVMSHVEP